MKRFAFLAAFALSGCAAIDTGEVIDQTGHYAQGRAMALELRANTKGGAAEIEALIMQYAEGREFLQDPGGECGEGCIRDLTWWEKGIWSALEGME